MPSLKNVKGELSRTSSVLYLAHRTLKGPPQLSQHPETQAASQQSKDEVYCQLSAFKPATNCALRSHSKGRHHDYLAKNLSGKWKASPRAASHAASPDSFLSLKLCAHVWGCGGIEDNPVCHCQADDPPSLYRAPRWLGTLHLSRAGQLPNPRDGLPRPPC